MAKRKSKSKNKHIHHVTKLEKFFYLSWKKFIFVLGLWILALVLHNVISGIYNVEEPFFFLIAVILIPIYLIKSVIYTLAHKRIHLKYLS